MVLAHGVVMAELVGGGTELDGPEQLTPGSQQLPKELPQELPGGHTHWLLQHTSPTVGLKQKRLPFGLELAQVWYPSPKAAAQVSPGAVLVFGVYCWRLSSSLRPRASCKCRCEAMVVTASTARVRVRKSIVG